MTSRTTPARRAATSTSPPSTSILPFAIVAYGEVPAVGVPGAAALPAPQPSSNAAMTPRSTAPTTVGLRRSFKVCPTVVQDLPIFHMNDSIGVRCEARVVGDD